ncbi:hypothetical protein [Gynuella sp.]|uniref:hypothetical protein n=1 Tax=Gynuella sp. TaxID=2969146 RepID=UPI003D0DCC29
MTQFTDQEIQKWEEFLKQEKIQKSGNCTPNLDRPRSASSGGLTSSGKYVLLDYLPQLRLKRMLIRLKVAYRSESVMFASLSKTH